MLDGILWILHTGAPWRDLPERFGPWSSVYNTFRRWQNTGHIDAILEALQRALTDAGFDTGGTDGVIGTKTKAAISTYQQATGLPVTGEPSLDLLRRFR